MSFILVPKHGDDIQINAWNWRTTLEILRAENIIDPEALELMGLNGCGAEVDADLAQSIAEAVARQLQGMRLGERVRADLQVTADPKKVVRFDRPEAIDAVDLYSATYEWLVAFKGFCERCGGFKVV